MRQKRVTLKIYRIGAYHVFILFFWYLIDIFETIWNTNNIIAWHYFWRIHYFYLISLVFNKYLKFVRFCYPCRYLGYSSFSTEKKCSQEYQVSRIQNLWQLSKANCDCSIRANCTSFLTQPLKLRSKNGTPKL